MRIHKIPRHPGRHGYLPAEAVERVDGGTDVLVLRPGITADSVAGAPRPPDEDEPGSAVALRV